MVSIAGVYLWEQRVGTLSWDEKSRIGSFEYATDFVSTNYAIAPLKMPSAVGTIYSFSGLNKDTYKGLPACLADSLPDDFGNAVINAWLAKQGRPPSSLNPVERLLYTGSRGMGALEYRPAAKVAATKNEKIELEKLIELTIAMMRNREALTLNLDDETALAQLIAMGTSAGGARPKVVIALNAAGDIRSGQVPAPQGFSYWLLKFDLDTSTKKLGEPAGWGRIEYAYSQMARCAGIVMSECRLLQDGERAHFMTRRFDRLDNGDKLHAQTLCAIAHADYKKPGSFSYEEAFGVLRQLQLSRDEAIEFYRRMVFNVISRNQDDHSKNISFLMDREGRWSLSPAYDVIWACDPTSPWINAHQMSIQGKCENITEDDLIATAKHISNFDPLPIFKQVCDAVAAWPEFARQAGVDEKNIRSIGLTHKLNLFAFNPRPDPPTTDLASDPALHKTPSIEEPE